MSQARYTQGLVVFNATTGTAMTGISTLTSIAVDMRTMQTGMFIMAWTGTPVGSFSLEGSNDWDAQKGTGKWTALSMVGTGNPAGSASDTYCQIIDSAASWVRLKYTNTTSTGVLSATFSGKGNG